MTISGLVLTLNEDPRAQTQAIEELKLDTRLQLGVRIGQKLPVVAETADANEGEALVEALGRRPGISFVDVVYVDFSEAPGLTGA